MSKAKAKVDALRARLDVMGLALAALARAVPPEQAAALQEGFRREVAARLESIPLSPTADAAVAADLCSLMSALGGQTPSEPDRTTLAG